MYPFVGPDWFERPADKSVCEGDDLDLTWKYPDLGLGIVKFNNSKIFQTTNAESAKGVIELKMKNISRDRQGKYEASAYAIHSDFQRHDSVQVTVNPVEECAPNSNIVDAILVFSMDNHVKVSSSSVKHVCIQAGANVSVGVEQESLQLKLTLTSTCPHVTGRETLTLRGTMKSDKCEVVLKDSNGSKTVRVTSIGKFGYF